MTYSVYADVILIYSILINAAVLFVTSIILHVHIHPLRIFFWSSITGLTTEAEYLLMLNRNRIIHYILYVTIYIIMILFYFGRFQIQFLWMRIIALLGSMSVIYGILGIFKLTGHPHTLYDMTFGTCISILLISFAAVIFIYKKKYSQNIYYIRLIQGTNEITCRGYMDSGNLLHDQYNHAPVIILDYRLLRDMTGPRGYAYIEEYHKNGDFNYAAFANASEIKMYPLPYRTISAEFALMPAFRLTSLTFLHTGETYTDVTAGISRYPFTNNRCQILLNEDLKPNREENSND